MVDCSKTENYFIEKLRMTKRTKNGLCEIKCSNCPLCSNRNGEGLPCPEFEMYYPEKAIEIVQRWSDEHPRRTYLSEFLKNYPNARLKIDGTPKGVCLYHLGLISVDDCKKDPNCIKCWNQPMRTVKSDERNIKNP